MVLHRLHPDIASGAKFGVFVIRTSFDSGEFALPSHEVTRDERMKGVARHDVHAAVVHDMHCYCPREGSSICMALLS